MSTPKWAGALRRVSRLSPREHDVFVLLALAESNHEMADRLHVTERTVRAHLNQILAKLDVPSRLAASLASYAYQRERGQLGDPAPQVVHGRSIRRTGGARPALVDDAAYL